MRILVTGITGQLGHDVLFELNNRGHETIGTSRRKPEIQTPLFFKVDLSDESGVKAVVNAIRPNAIIHCAAWSAVDAAEDAENHDAAYRANVLATKYLAETCAETQVKMLYLSTDYVFNGQGTRPWQPDDRCYAPLNWYRETKLEGELAVSSTLEKYFIVRIAWVFGKNGKTL